MYLSRVDLRFSFWEISAFVFIRLIFSNHLLQYSLRGHQFVFEDPVHFWKLTLNDKPERGNPLVRIIGSVSPIWESSMRAISSRYKLNTMGKGSIHPYCQNLVGLDIVTSLSILKFWYSCLYFCASCNKVFFTQAPVHESIHPNINVWRKRIKLNLHFKLLFQNSFLHTNSG